MDAKPHWIRIPNVFSQAKTLAPPLGAEPCATVKYRFAIGIAPRYHYQSCATIAARRSTFSK